MISKEFVQKCLDVKEMLDYEAITELKYKILILDLCHKYEVDPAKLAEYNMDIEPRKFDE